MGMIIFTLGFLNVCLSVSSFDVSRGGNAFLLRAKRLSGEEYEG